MVKVCVEVREGDGLFRVDVQAESISQAVSIAKGSHPDRDVRVVSVVTTYTLTPDEGTPMLHTRVCIAPCA